MQPNQQVERGLSRAQAVIDRVARAVREFVRANLSLDAGQLIAKLRAELGGAEPLLAAALESGILAAWLGAARGPARDAAPVRDPAPAVPVPPAGALDDAPRVRYPAVEAAVRDLLARRVLTPDTYAKLSGDARDAAFTVARVLSADAVGAVRDAIAADLAHGGGYELFVDEVGPLLARAGLSGRDVETVYRTQTGLAQAAGLRAVLEHPLVGPEFPYVAYHATHDGRTRDDHLALETCGIQGTNVYRCDDPVIRRYWPPWGFNCRCLVQPLALEDAAALGIHEAREWLRTGAPPEEPERVPDPGFELPKGWPERTERVAPVF